LSRAKGTNIYYSQSEQIHSILLLKWIEIKRTINFSIHYIFFEVSSYSFIVIRRRLLKPLAKGIWQEHLENRTRTIFQFELYIKEWEKINFLQLLLCVNFLGFLVLRFWRKKFSTSIRKFFFPKPIFSHALHNFYT